MSPRRRRPYDPAIFSKQVRLLYERSDAAFVVNLIISTLLAVVERHAPFVMLAVWIGGIFSVTIVRLAINRAYRRAADPDADPRTWARRYAGGAFASALLLGAVAAMMLGVRSGSPMEEAFVIVTVVGTASGGASVLSGVFPLAVAYVILTMAPLAIAIAAYGDGLHTALTIMVVMYIAFLVYATRRSNDFVVSTLSLRSENEALIARMERQQASLSHRLGRILGDSSIEIIAIDAVTMRVIQANAGAVANLGYSEDDLLQCSACDLWPALTPECANEIAARLRSGEHTRYTATLWHQRKDHSWYPVEVNFQHSVDDDTEILLAVGTDISRRIEAEEHARKLSQAVEQSPVATVIINASGVLEYANARFETISGSAASQLLGQAVRNVAFGDHLARGCDALVATRGANRWTGEAAVDRTDGTRCWVTIVISPIEARDERVTHFLGVVEDITDRKRHDGELEYQATHDALTGLPNRALAFEVLGATIAGAKRFGRRAAVLFIDLDNFKAINDSLGHAAGDHVLREIARRLVDTAAAVGTAARLSGDEFVVIAPDVGDATSLASAIAVVQSVFREAFEFRDQRFFVTGSIGVAVCPDDASDPEILLRNADTAMYSAKANGRDSFAAFSETLRERSERRFAVEAALHGAIERNELRLTFQPQVDLASGALVGAEALLRWTHPDYGAIAPDEFIPIAEDNGTISPIGGWVLRQACETFKRVEHHLDDRFTMFINVSPRQFRDASFPVDVAAAIQNSGMREGSLGLEITENVLMADSPALREALSALRGMGVRLALDDFGKGWSSLSYLRHFSFDKLKIDRTFVDDIMLNDSGTKLCTAIVAIGRSLELEVVAEGLSCVEQIATLRAAGVQVGQGYYFGHPLEAGAFAELCASRARWPVAVAGTVV